MNRLLYCVLIVSCLSVHWSQAKPPLDVTGEDDASQGAYNSGWGEGRNGGDGFGPWTLRTATNEGAEHSHAGFYIAPTSEKKDLKGAAIRDKAFGLYANGTSFEVATAFRAFARPLRAGQSFSFLMEHGRFVKKFDVDDLTAGSVGIVLRSATGAEGVNDYNKAARFEFGYYQGDTGAGYQIFDGDRTKKLPLSLAEGGLAVTITLATENTYDLEITVLAKKQTTRLEGRRLGGEVGAEIRSFALFDRNGETSDAYFNGFQILQPPE